MPIVRQLLLCTRDFEVISKLNALDRADKERKTPYLIFIII
jgi:hypothetical protein